MLGSRYLNPYFGSGIYTWASLISTVLIALTVGYFLGGLLADRTASPAVLALTVIIGSVYLLALPSFAQAILETRAREHRRHPHRQPGRLAGAHVLSRDLARHVFAVRHPAALRSPQSSGRVSGAVYGISTSGSIVGTLGTTFFLIPTIGSRAITLTLGAVGLLAGLALLALSRLHAPRLRRARGCRARHGHRAEHFYRPRREPDRRRRPGRDAQAPQRPHRPYRDRVQRHLHHQAPKPAGDVVPGQGLGLHGIGGQPQRSRRPAAALRAGDDDRDRLSRDAEEDS